jgi:hypothetical protein
MYVCLLVICIALSVPQDGTNKGNRNPHSDGQKKESVASKQSFGPSYFVEQPTIKGTEQQYDPYYDRLYRAYLAATIVSAFLSLGVIGMLIWQNYLTRQVATAAQSSAKSAEASAEALVKSQQAWVSVEFVNILKMFRNTQDGQVKTTLRCLFINHGQTPAWTMEFRCQMEVVENNPTNQDFESVKLREVPPQYLPAKQVIDHEKHNDGSFELPLSCPSGQGHLIIYGILKYRDAFGNRTRYTTFGYEDDTRGQNPVPFRRMNAEAYNRNA